MVPPARNVECKARDADPAATLARALELQPTDHGELTQRDTYFAVDSGRLKLREEAGPTGTCAQLMAYLREDDPEPRVSDYRIAPVSDPARLREALGATLGVRAVVSKRRRLLVCDGVRIHLDDVAGQGRFIELEAVAAPDSDLSDEATKVARLRRALAIADEDLLAGSYVDGAEEDPALADVAFLPAA